MTEIEKLEQGIAALEMQRATLGDDLVEAMLAPIREKLAALRASEPHSRTEQRKQVTVLFADVSGFTAMSEKLDAEEVLDRMNALWAKLDAAILAQGGVIDKHIGDAVMALFGIPTAREDDPERAIYAALAMQSELLAFRREHGISLAMRIGIHTGAVILGSVGSMGEYTAMGDTVNLASRLEHAAPIGGILISLDTYRQVRGAFELQTQPLLTVKGKAEPVQTYVVLRAKPRAFRLHRRGVEGIDTRMIGRTGELQQLQAAVRRIVDYSEMHMVLVVGEAGVGKSRLLYEFEHWLDQFPEPVIIFKARANESLMNLPYSFMREMVVRRLEISDNDPLATACQKLERGVVGWLVGDPEAVMKSHFIGQLIGLDYSHSPYLHGILDDPQQIHNRALHYLLQFFQASSRPVIFLLDDLHWADDGSMEILAYLRKHGGTLPILVMGLTRPSLFERRVAWTADQRLDLGPLSEAESCQLVEEILQKVPEIPAALRDLVVKSAEGNPFYVEEFIKMLIDQAVIVPGESRWQVELNRLSALRVPPTLTGVLQARLDELSPVEREFLQRAAVVGRVFWDNAVEFLGQSLPEPMNPRLQDVLETLRSRELVFDRDASTFRDTGEYLFKHALLQEVTYETVLKRERRIYHARAATWLIEKSGERGDEYAGLIAEHSERAGDLLAAAEWYGRAAKQAAGAYMPETAISYYQKALEIAQKFSIPDAWKLDWYKGLGRALRLRARYTEALEVFAPMRALAESLGDELMLAQTWNELAVVHSSMGNHRLALEDAENAEMNARMALVQHGNEAAQVELSNALRRKGWSYYRLGEAATAISLAEQSLALCEGLSEFQARNWRVNNLNLLGAAYVALGRFAQADQYREQALALFRELGDRQSVGMMLNNLGETARLRGDYAAAVQRYQEALRINREIGSQASERLCLNNLGGARVGLKDYAAAEMDLRRVLELVGRGTWFALSETHRFLAEACLGQGRIEEALAEARQALTLGQAAGNKEFIAQAWRVLGNCGLSVGDLGRVPGDAGAPLFNDPAACYAESLRIFAEIGAEAERARALRDWARYLAKQGNKERAATLFQEARAVFERLEMIAEAGQTEG